MRYVIPLLIIINLPLFTQQYFYSNSLAMELSEIFEIDSLEIGESQWILETYTTGKRKETILYNFGVEKKRSVSTPLQYTEIVDGIIREETNYRSDGQISEVIFFNESGDLTGKENYLYSAEGKLLSISFSGGEEDLSTTREYALREDGSLRLISRYKDSAREPDHREFWNSYKGRFFMEERLYDSSREVVYFNEDNNISSILQYAGEILIFEETRGYDSYGKVKTIEKFFPETEKKYLESMDESGRIVKEEYFDRGKMIYRLNNIYRGSTLVQTDKSTGSLREKWIFYYGEEKNVGEDYYRQGELQQKKIVTDGDTNSYKVELYDDGELFMNLIYSEDVKIREEFISDGVIVRTRELGDR